MLSVYIKKHLPYGSMLFYYEDPQISHRFFNGMPKVMKTTRLKDDLWHL